MVAMASSDLPSPSSHSPIHTTPSLSSSDSSSAPSPSHVCDSLHNLSSSIQGLISLHPTARDTFSDVSIYASGKSVHLHRCILAARSPFFRALFSKDRRDLSYLSPCSRGESSIKEDLSVIRLDLEKILKMVIKETGSRIGTRIRFDAFWATMLFLYSGKVSIQTVKCIDTECLHEVCLPSVKFAVEMLCLSSVFDIHELKSLFQVITYLITSKPQWLVYLIKSKKP